MRLASFRPSEAAIADDLIIGEFPPSLPTRSSAGGLLVNNGAGLVVVFGKAGNETQTIVGIAVDAAGNLQKKWALSHPNPFEQDGDAVTNADGSIVYYFYNDSSPKLDKIRADALDGVMKLQKIRQDNGLPPLCRAA